MPDVSLVHNAGCSWTTIGRHLGTVTMLTNRNVLINEQHSSKVHAGTPSPHEKPQDILP